MPYGTRRIATLHHNEFPTADLVEAKGSHVISVILPARNEERTIGAIVDRIVGDLMTTHGLVDETIVIDSESTDSTAHKADQAGATVLAARDIMAEFGPPLGKGDVLWRSVQASKGDLIVWVDADIEDFDSRFVTGVLGPLLTDDEVQLSKGFYTRPIADDDGTLADTGGGRVTELTARPALALLYPELAEIIQPLSGEYAIRREAAEVMPFAKGYGVEVGLLIDIATRFGVDAIVQVDLERRVHRNRQLGELSKTAFEVLHAVLSRSGVEVPDVEGFPRAQHAMTTEVRTDVGDRPPHADRRLK